MKLRHGSVMQNQVEGSRVVVEYVESSREKQSHGRVKYSQVELW